MNRPVIIIGTGGHAKVLVEILRLSNIKILGATDIDPRKIDQSTYGIKVIGNDDVVIAHSAANVSLVNGVGSVCVMSRRGEIFERFKAQGYEFASVIHPSAVISPGAVLSEGVQIMAGAVVQSGSKIGVNTIVNTNAVIEHDCEIEKHVHVASGSILCGGVKIGDYTHIGAGATVIQQVCIGASSLIAAGAVVIKDIGNNTTVAGVPAREINR